jgi:methionyl-tRNA synthetase
LHAEAQRKTRVVLERYEALDFAGALAEIWSSVGELNSDIVVHAPWEMAKDGARRDALEFFQQGGQIPGRIAYAVYTPCPVESVVGELQVRHVPFAERDPFGQPCLRRQVLSGVRK